MQIEDLSRSNNQTSPPNLNGLRNSCVIFFLMCLIANFFFIFLISVHQSEHINFFHLQTLLRDCLQPASSWLAKEVAHGNTPVHKMFHTIEGGLSYRYHSSWGLVLQVLNVFFEVNLMLSVLFYMYVLLAFKSRKACVIVQSACVGQKKKLQSGNIKAWLYHQLKKMKLFFM